MLILNHSAHSKMHGKLQSHTEVASELLLRSLKSVWRGLKVAALDWRDDVEYVHQVRVATRRALATIDFFDDVIPKPHRRWFRKTLQTVIQATRRARELDVLLTEKQFRRSVSSKHLRRNLQSARLDAQQPIIALRQKLAYHDRFRKHIRRLKNDFVRDASDSQSIQPESARLWCCAKFGEICHRFSDRMFSDFDAKSLHKRRIQTKQLRYTIDVIQQVSHIPKLVELKELVVEMQSQLGRIQDDVTAKSILQRSLKKTKKAAEEKYLSTLIDARKQQLAAHIEAFRSWWSSDDGQRFIQCLDEILQ